MSSSGRRILVLALDGATFNVLEPMIQAGHMPHLAELMDRGAHAKLRTIVPPITPAAWSSFLTGKEPARHGVLDFRVFDPQSFTDRFISARDIAGETLLSLASRAGKNVCCINLPMTYPPPKIKGLVISGFDAPGTHVDFTHPPQLSDEIRATFGDYFFIPHADTATDESFERLIQRTRRAFQLRGELARMLLPRRPWDLFIVNFQSLDALQHKAYRYLDDRLGPAAKPNRRKRVIHCMRELDEQLGMIIRDAKGKFDLIFVVSDHGFGPRLGTIYANQLLQEWGYLTVRSAEPAAETRTLKQRLLANKALGRPLRWLRDFYWSWSYARKHFAQRRAASGFRRLPPLAQRLPVDLHRTRAFVALGHVGAMCYLNRREKSPLASASEQQLAAMRRELKERLATLTNPLTGAPAFEEVIEGPAYFGPTASKKHVPDLILVPAEGFAVSVKLSPRVFITAQVGDEGEHRFDGVFIVCGEGLKRAGLLPQQRIIDMAPTILAAMGVAVPEDMDGRPLEELLELQVSYGAATSQGKLTEAGLSEQDQAQLAERLRDLGYID